MVIRLLLISTLGISFFLTGCETSSQKNEIDYVIEYARLQDKQVALDEKLGRRDREIELLRKHLPAVIHPITQKMSTNVNQIITDKLTTELGSIPRKNNRVFNVRRVDLGGKHGILITVDVICRNLAGTLVDDALVTRTLRAMMKESVRNFGYDKLYINLYNSSVIADVENLVIGTPHPYQLISKVTDKFQPAKKIKTNGEGYLTEESHDLATVNNRKAN